MSKTLFKFVFLPLLFFYAVSYTVPREDQTIDLTHVMDYIVENAEKGDVDQIMLCTENPYHLQTAASIAAAQGKVNAVRVLEGVKNILIRNKMEEERKDELHKAEVESATERHKVEVKREKIGKELAVGVAATIAFGVGILIPLLIKDIIRFCAIKASKISMKREAFVQDSLASMGPI